MNTDDKDVVTADEAALRLGVSRSTITILLRNGDLRGYRLTMAPNSPFRVYVESIEELERRRQYKPPADASGETPT